MSYEDNYIYDIETQGHIDQDHPKGIKVIIYFLYIYDTTSTNDTREGKNVDIVRFSRSGEIQLGRITTWTTPNQC